MKDQFTHLYASLILKRPIISLLAVLVVLGLLCTQLSKFRFDASAESLVLENDLDYKYFLEINKRYKAEDFLLVTYTPNGDLFAEKSLANLAALQDDLAAMPGVSNVVSILDIPLLESPKTSLTALAGGEINTLRNNKAIDIELVKKELTNSPLYEQLLTSADNKTTAIQVNLNRDAKYNDLQEARNALRDEKLLAEDAWTAEQQAELEASELAFRLYSEEFSNQRAEMVAQARQIIENYRNDGTRLFLGGVPMIASDMITFVKSDLVVFGTGIFIFIILTLIIIFRQFSQVLLPLLTCASTVVAMLGLTSWMDWPMTVISSNFVALLLIITLSMSIHLVVRYRELLQRNPQWSQQELVVNMAKQMIVPCIFTTLTTNVAFTSLVVSGIRPVIDFGKMMTLGVSVALVMTFIVLPAGLLLFKKPKVAQNESQKKPFTLWFAKFTERFGTVISLLTISLIAVSAYGISQLKVENRFIDYFHSDTEIYQGMEVIDQQLGGTIPLEIIIDALSFDGEVETANESYAIKAATKEDLSFEQDFEADFESKDIKYQPVEEVLDDEFAEDLSDDFSNDYVAESDEGFEEDLSDDFSNDSFDGSGFDEENFEDESFGDDTAVQEDFTASSWFTQYGLDRVESAHDYLNSLDETGKVMSLATLAKVLDIIAPGYDDIQLALIQSKLPDSISGTVVKPYLDVENDQARIIVRVKETSRALQRNELLEQIENHLVNELGFKPEQVHLTGMLVLYNNMLQSLFTSQILTLGFVFLCIMAMFWLLFRSLSLAFIAIAPNLLAAGAVLGLMGLLGIPLDIMTVTIAAIAVGIGVDNTIHYVHRFKTEFAKRRNYLETMYFCHQSTGRAMYYTSIAIIVGFSILSLSNFNPSIYFGLLTASAMILALLGALVLLPLMFIMFKPLGSNQSSSNQLAKDQ